MANKAVSSAIAFDLTVEAGAWPNEAALDELARHAVDAAASFLTLQARQPAELSLLFTDDAHMRVLNGNWRGKDSATNVLSFPASDLAPGDTLPPLLGDIVLAHETVKDEAGLENKSFDDHLTHLIVHGLLHLLGYDHSEPAQAGHMESCERAILARLGINDPYA